MSDNTTQDVTGQARRKVKIRYESLSALFANQFVVNRSEDDITIGFSSGAIDDPAAEGMLLPVHSRVAMSLKSARKLIDILSKALESSPGSSCDTSEARLPRIDAC